MSFLSKTSLLLSRQPLIQFQRNRAKINIQRPRLPHYERTRIVAVTQPKFEEPPKTKTCFQLNPRLKANVENPYNDIIAREVKNWLDNSRMIVFFHKNSITADELFNVKVKLYKENMHLKYYGKKIIAMAVTNTKYEEILPLFDSENCIVFSPKECIAQLVRATRKVPQLLLLGGIIDDVMLSQSELIKLANMPKLPIVQAELVQTLNLAAQGLINNLSAHQVKLVQTLNVIAKTKSEQ